METLIQTESIELFFQSHSSDCIIQLNHPNIPHSHV